MGNIQPGSGPIPHHPSDWYSVYSCEYKSLCICIKCSLKDLNDGKRTLGEPLYTMTRATEEVRKVRLRALHLHQQYRWYRHETGERLTVLLNRPLFKDLSPQIFNLLKTASQKEYERYQLKNVKRMNRGNLSIISGLRWNTRDTSATWTTPMRRSPSPTRAWRWCGPGWAQRGRKSQLCDGGQRDTPWHDMGDQWWCPELEHDRGHVSRVYFLMLHAVTKHYTKSDTVMWIIWRDVVGCCCFHFIARVIRHCETEVHRPGARWLPDTVLTDKYNDGRAQRSRKSDKSWHIQKLSYSQILQLLLITLDSRYVYILRD